MIDFTIFTTNGIPSMAYDQSYSLFNNVWLSLTIQRGSWWFNPVFGSRLYVLRRMKNTPQTAALAVDYAKEALQWLLDTGRATAVTVATERDIRTTARLKLLITITAGTVTYDPYTYFVEVV